MNANRMLVVAVALATLSAFADGWTVLDGGWRISGGAVYDPGVKTSLRFTPRVSYTSPFAAGRSKADAQSLGQGDLKKGAGGELTRREFQNGAWIDTADPAVAGQGEQAGYTWYYKFPQGTWDGGDSFLLGSADYSEVRSWSSNPQVAQSHADDEAGVLGFNIELSRNLYHDEEHNWGVDVGFAVQYFKHNGIFDMFSSWTHGGSRQRRGNYSASVDLPRGTVPDMGDDYSWGGETGSRYFGVDGTLKGDRYVNSYGEGTQAGPIPGSSLQLRNTESIRTDSSSGSLRADGDYDNLELMLLAHPYYDVTEWLRISGTVGLVVSRQDLDFTMTIRRDNEIDYRSARDFSQWDVYGVAGGGLMLRYEDFTLSGDILARFLDDDLTVDDPYAHGTIERGRWMIKLSIGYEF